MLELKEGNKNAHKFIFKSPNFTTKIGKQLLFIFDFIIYNSSSLKNNNINKNFFPSDFFPKFISSKNNIDNNSKKSEQQKIKSKSTYINLQKDEEEDRELIKLLEGKTEKGKQYFYFIIFL